MSLQMYLLQLQQVRAALSQDCSDSNRSDLEELEENLVQLISLTESSSTNILNSDARNAGEEVPAEKQSDSHENNMEDELANFYKDIGNIKNNDEQTPQCSTQNVKLSPNEKTGISLKNSTNQLNDEFLDSIENLNDICGVKCQAPFVTEWQGTQYHNAMIKCPVDNNTEDPDNPEDITVKVLFLNPTTKSMQPCSYYLDGNCNYDEEDCWYSHGHITSLYDLRPYVPANFDNLKEGSRCLAKMEDGLWKPAVVEKIDGEYYHVKFTHKDNSMILGLEHIIPEQDHQGDEISDDEEDVVTELAPPPAYYSKSGELKNDDAGINLGLWEQHTKGIGLKLLLKMGYKHGGGLGKSSQGRLEPIPILILPPGKSLDHCMKIKESKGLKNSSNQGDVQSLVQKNHRPRKQKNVFTFLNKALGDQVLKKKEVERSKDIFGIKQTRDNTAVKKYSQEMFKNDEKKKKFEQKLRHVRDAIKRNQGNPSVLQHLRNKAKDLEENLEKLKECNATLKMHKSRMETHKKMTMF